MYVHTILNENVTVSRNKILLISNIKLLGDIKEIYKRVSIYQGRFNALQLNLQLEIPLHIHLVPRYLNTMPEEL